MLPSVSRRLNQLSVTVGGRSSCGVGNKRNLLTKWHMSPKSKRYQSVLNRNYKNNNSNSNNNNGSKIGSSIASKKEAGLVLCAAPIVMMVVASSKLQSEESAGISKCIEKHISFEKEDLLFEHRGTEGNLSKCYELLVATYKNGASEQDKKELNFRIARAAYNLLTSGDPLDDKYNASKEDKKKLAEFALEVSNEAVRVSPDDFRSYYWVGICTQAYGDHVAGTKYTLERLSDIRQNFEKAAELAPYDGTTKYCLGSWCYSLADLGWVSRKLAATLFATPPTSSFEEALEFFLEAERVEPDFYNKNVLMIAKSYEKLGNKSKVAEYAKICMERPCTNDEDDRVQKEAAALYNKYK